MKKIILGLIISFITTLFIIILILSTIGIETNKFNNFITNKIYHSNLNIKLELQTIRFKIDVKEISLFLETINPKVNYKNNLIPTKNIKVYLEFLSFIKSKPQIKKISFSLEKLDIKEIKKISSNFKPSNFTSFLNNKIDEGTIDTKVEVYFNENNTFDNFIARGSVSDLKAKLIGNLSLEKTNFKFFADKTDVLLKDISCKTSFLKINNGDLRISLEPEIEITSNFITKIKFDSKKNKLIKLKNLDFFENITVIEADINNNFTINFDKTYKIKNYNLKNNGKISRATFKYEKPFKNYLINEKVKILSINNSDIKANFSQKKKNIVISGEYSLNKDNFLEFELENTTNNKISNLNIKFDYAKYVKIDFVNYEKPKGKVASVALNLDKSTDKINIKKLNFKEDDNQFFIKDLKLTKGKFNSFKTVTVKTNKNGIINNNFEINSGKNIKVIGSQFDASKLPKILSKEDKTNLISNLSSEIEIDFTNIIAPLSEKIKNFKLIGKIERGKFIKISSKGSFNENNHLDISMKYDKKNKKRFLEVYSDLTRPLLTEYNFFKGLTGGKLLYSSTIEDKISSSKLKIENFKVINAPDMVKLLSLADLSGLADLAQGEGLSFDILEISMKKKGDTLNLNEILAIGPSMSVIMEGYQNSKVTSLRGTLVPAKTLNKMIAKIPVIGNIIIPKEVGEGLFGISFKMKGPPGKIKTTINPLRTLTPRFIQKIIEKNNKPK